jgi:hypothetical protein
VEKLRKTDPFFGYLETQCSNLDENWTATTSRAPSTAPDNALPENLFFLGREIASGAVGEGLAPLHKP